MKRQIKLPHFILQLIIDSGHQHDNSLATAPEVVGWFVVECHFQHKQAIHGIWSIYCVWPAGKGKHIVT